MFNPQAASMQAPQSYFHPNGPQVSENFCPSFLLMSTYLNGLGNKRSSFFAVWAAYDSWSASPGRVHADLSSGKMCYMPILSH